MIIVHEKFDLWVILIKGKLFIYESLSNVLVIGIVLSVSISFMF